MDDIANEIRNNTEDMFNDSRLSFGVTGAIKQSGNEVYLLNETELECVSSDFFDEKSSAPYVKRKVNGKHAPENKNGIPKDLEFENDLLFENSDNIMDGTDTGWAWVVLLVSFGTSCIIGGALYTLGIIQAILLDLFDGNVSTTSLVGALHTSLISITGPVSSALTDRYSCRVAIVLAGFLYLVGYMGTAFAPNIETAILTCGVISGLAGGLAYTANMVVISFYFKRRRHLALGISSSGLGIGLFIFAPTLQFLRNYYGPRGVFILMAGIFSHLVLFGIICAPSKFELLTRQRRNHRYKRTNDASACVLFKSYLKTLFNKGIFCFCVSTFSFCLGIYVMYLFYPEFISHRGYSASEAANFISISGISNVIGRILSGILANCQDVNGILLFSSSLGVVGIATCVYVLFAEYYIGQIAYFVVLGLFLGPSAVLQTNVSLKFVTVDNISQAIGLQLAFAGMGAIIGPVLAGVFVDNGGSYEHVLVTAAFFVFLGGVLSYLTACFSQIKTDTKEVKV